MKKNTNKAFTLVELIVVITILAILGTIAFISLQGYSAEARDSKRVADVANITKKMSIEVTKGAQLSNLVTDTSSGTVRINGEATEVYNQGDANFVTLRENEADFQDPTNNDNYLVSYAQGGSGTGAFKFYQAAATMEATNDAHVVGNYYLMASGDSVSILSDTASADLATADVTTPGDETDNPNAVVNDGANIPYSL